MNESSPKTEIKFIVTRCTRFNFNNEIKPLIRTYIGTKNNIDYQYLLLCIRIYRISAIECRDNHIYIHGEGAKYYTDIDFNLMSDKEQLSKCIFDQLLLLYQKCIKNDPDMRNKTFGSPFIYRMTAIRENSGAAHYIHNLIDDGHDNNNIVDQLCAE